MAFGKFQQQGNNAPFAEINVTPMVDVMLVLLVIFIITAPLFNHQIKLDLPKESAAALPNQSEAIAISIDTHGKLFWNNEFLPQEQLQAKLQLAAKKQPQPEILLRADNGTRYEMVVKVMAQAQQAGLIKLGFVTEPRAAPGSKDDK